METKIKIVAVRVGSDPVIEEIANTLEAMQAFVGGDIEEVGVTNELTNDIAFVCNEDGWSRGLRLNRKIKYIGWTVGDLFFVRRDRGLGELVSMTDLDTQEVLAFVKGNQ